MIPPAYLLLVTRRIKKDNKYPVKLRIVFLRAYHDYKTGINLTKDEFENSMIDKPKKQFRETKIKLDAIKVRADQIIKEMDVFNFSKFETSFYGRIKDASDVVPFFDEYIDSLKSEERIKTAISYQSAKNSLLKFKNKIGFYDITIDFLNCYHRWMKEPKGDSDNPRILSDTTIGIYVRTLRTIYNYAISKGVIKKTSEYPFGRRKYEIPSGRNIKKALLLSEVASINNYSTIKNSQEERAKDFWMFSYLCNGINFKDIALLKYKNIDGDMLRFVRSKTRNSTKTDQISISIFLGEHAIEIINKNKNNKNRQEDFLFDILTQEDDALARNRKIEQFIKTTNKFMKRICKNIGIEKKVTTYVSRHSSATILKKSGVNVEQIREQLGHTNTKTTQKYLDSFSDESKKELTNALVNFPLNNQ